MLATLALCLVIGATSLPPPGPPGIEGPPAEPGAVVLPERPTYQALVADLAGTGSRDLVRLVGGERDSIAAEVWRHTGDAWTRIGDEVEIVPELTGGSRDDVRWTGSPVRLIVRSVGDRERVTVVRQPSFEAPASDPPCCLLLHDLEVGDGTVRLRAVGSATQGVETILALDLDGDGTDELLGTRSAASRGRVPTAALLFRWRADAFGAPLVTELPVGSGHVPFVLGDTDGRPGVEAGVITSATRSALYRIVLDEAGALRAESSGLVAGAAMRVPLAAGGGVAVIGPLTRLAIHPWPPGEAAGPAVGSRDLSRASLVEVVEIGGAPALLVEQTTSSGLHVLRLPNLAAAASVTVNQGAASTTVEAGPLRAFRGALPGGGVDGGPAALYAGTVVPSQGEPASPLTGGAGQSVAFGGVEPVGLAGPGRAWLALLHGIQPESGLHRSGGRLEAPALRPGSGVSLVPLDLSLVPEREFGVLSPELVGAVTLDGRNELAVGADGFTAVVRAPPGSRVYPAADGLSEPVEVHVVPERGRVDVRLPPTGPAGPVARYRASLSVVTPAGGTYVAAWTARVLTEPPSVSAATATPIGSAAVDVRGTTAPYASVTVDGRTVPVDGAGAFVATLELPPWPTEVSVVATDPFGNVARTSVSGVGWFDYRALPWIPIAIVLLGGLAAVLYVRVPLPLPRRADDGTLEEIEVD